MSADVRALLKAKTQVGLWQERLDFIFLIVSWQERGKKITHPLAAYNASGQLRCTVCALIVKDNEVAWSGHLGSKAHRTNVGRQKEMVTKEEERKRLEKGKRKVLDEDDAADESMEEDEPNARMVRQLY
jgi:deoxycytidylate deaminase